MIGKFVAIAMLWAICLPFAFTRKRSAFKIFTLLAAAALTLFWIMA